MKIIVQKFGGTSLDSADKRSVAIEHIEDARSKGYGVVVVVSAMGRNGEPYSTDTLLSLVSEDDIAARDKDALMACGEVISAVKFANSLGKRGIAAVVLNGQQAGILTDCNFGNAQVLDVQPQRIFDALQLGQIPVVTGFQGASQEGDITTLGRGGSDTTAVLVGVALGAECVEIFTDVDGIMTCDPRIVSSAQSLTHLSYQEMNSLVLNGATVLHPSAVQVAEEK